MFNPALIPQIPSRTVGMVACGGIGICSLALMAALSVGGDAKNLEKGSSAAPQAVVTDGPDEPEEAPTGFNNSTNGFQKQEIFDKDRAAFEEVEKILPEKTPSENGDARTTKAKRRASAAGGTSETQSHGGLGPVYNATSCVSCHQNPVTGSSSQVSEIRAGHLEPDPKDTTKLIFIEPKGGSVIHQRAIDAAAQEHVPEDEDIPPERRLRTLRMSTNILGNGFVEVIPDKDILAVRSGQPEGLKGYWVPVPVAVGPKEGGGFNFVHRIGRFGWKCQEASLLNFSAGAYKNEMGITSPLQPTENLSNGRDVSQFDQVPDPEDPDGEEHPFGEDVEAFVRLMRSFKAPPRDLSLAGTDDVKAGEGLFNDKTKEGKDLHGPKLGCAVCHRPSYITPKAGTLITALFPVGKAGSDLKESKVPPALGNKIIHPYSDFMVHDIGTKDGIVQTQHAQRPPRGAENLQRIPDGFPASEGMLRIDANPLRGTKRRVLSAAPGLDQKTINMVRTAPLWGLRVRPQLLHDGSALTLDDAIRAHKVQSKAGNVVLPGNYDNLTNEQKKQLKAFLRSL